MAFDNLSLTQPRLSMLLEDNYRKNLLPQSILFSGPSGSSRLTASLDLSFLLTGEDRKTLRTQSVIYFPHRELMQRLKSAVNLFIRDRNILSKDYLIETMRIINMQYNANLISSLSPSLNYLFGIADSIDIFLTDLEDVDEITDNVVNDLKKLIKDNHLLDDSKFLYSGKKNPQSITIDQIRAIKEWMNTIQGKRVVIIEDLESATEGAKNSILKMLEEPLEDFTIILLSREKQKIMETILSRVRKYDFPPLSKHEVSSLIRTRFNDYNSYSSFDTFFFETGNDSETVKECEKAISSYSSYLINNSQMDLITQEQIASLLDSLSCYRFFRERVIENIEEALFSNKVAPYRARKLLSIIDYYSECIETYNMSERMGLDLIYREARNV